MKAFIKELKERLAFKKLVKTNKAPVWSKRRMLISYTVAKYDIWHDTVSYKYHFLGEFDPPPYDKMPRRDYLSLGKKGFFDTNC